MGQYVDVYVLLEYVTSTPMYMYMYIYMYNKCTYCAVYTCRMVYHYYCPGSEVEVEVISVMRERIPLAASQPLTHTL